VAADQVNDEIYRSIQTDHGPVQRCVAKRRVGPVATSDPPDELRTLAVDLADQRYRRRLVRELVFLDRESDARLDWRMQEHSDLVQPVTEDVRGAATHDDDVAHLGHCADDLALGSNNAGGDTIGIAGGTYGESTPPLKNVSPSRSQSDRTRSSIDWMSSASASSLFAAPVRNPRSAYR
jgi:hypothetical protein